MNKKLFRMCKMVDVFNLCNDSYFKVVLKVLKMVYEDE